LSIFVAACGDNGSPTNPTPPAPSTPTPPPAPTLVSLTGTVSALTGGGIVGATVRIGDGANAGRTTQTTAGGSYRFDNLTASDANISASAAGYEEKAGGVYINGTNALNFTLRPPTWVQSGSGNTVFDMPRYVTRVHIRGVWNGSGTSNFIVHVGGRGVVNEILRNASNRTYEGIHAVTGGMTEIVNSSAIAWSFTEVR
jgi:hypothetical protein